jgi:hypothetical protein
MSDKMMRPIALALCLLALPALAAEPEFRKDGLHAEAYGMRDGYPVGTRATQNQQRNLIGSLSHFDEIYPTRIVARPRATWSFRRDGTLPPVRYEHQGGHYDLNEYIDRNPVVGHFRNADRSDRIRNRPALPRQHVDLTQLGDDLFCPMPLPRHRCPPWSETIPHGGPLLGGQDRCAWCPACRAC